MASSTSQAHPAFPPRQYPSTALHGTGKLPDRSAALGLGASSQSHNIREFTRLERERQERERQERDRAAAAQKQQLEHQAGSNVGSMAQITDEQRDEINEAFGLFDLDKDQLIDYHEFKVALKALGFDLPKPELLSQLTAHGMPPPSYQSPVPCPPSRLRLTLPAFQTIASNLIAARDPREEILRAFALFDTDGKGMITLDDLRRVARELNEGLEEDELVAMIEEFDLEGKGGVGKEEFVGICMS